MPKLSIIIPVQGCTEGLKETLDSVLGQSMAEIEVLCAVWGSAGGSSEVVQTYAKRDTRIKMLHPERESYGAALNCGLRDAEGEYIAFLMPGDRMMDYAPEALYNKAVKYDLDLVKTASIVYETKEKTTVDVPELTLTGLGTGDFNRLLTMDEGSPIYRISEACWNGMYRRSFLEENALYFDETSDFCEILFSAAVIAKAGRMMAARDRVVMHTIQSEELEPDKTMEGLEQSFREIEALSNCLQEYQVEMSVLKRILLPQMQAFLELFDMLRCDSGQKQVACQLAEQWMTDYKGSFRPFFFKIYQETLRKSPVQRKNNRQLTKLPVFHKACRSPKVSVVVPTYNVEDYLNEALQSLTDQTLEQMEFICINDGSTDNSLVIMKEYAAVDARFKILDGPNGGYGKGMNRGLDAATGKYLGILEPDDFVPGEMFKELYRHAVRKRVDFVKADFYRFTVRPDGTLNKNLVRLTGKKSYYGRVLCPGDDLKPFFFIMNTWCGIYRVDFLRKWKIRHNETPGASFQDNGFYFQTFCRAKRALFVDKPYYMNRRDNPNSSVANRGKIYCVTEEYRFIWDWMQKDQELVRKFQSVYYARKFDNFMVTYRRLAPCYQLEYLLHIRDEFAEPLGQGLMSEELQGAVQWKQLNEIVADPEAYFNRICVSVIMPVYNAERYLEQTIGSLLAFNECQFELICVDDGSTDGSLEMLREYERRDNRVHVYTQKNAGAGAARNTGLKYAHGEYLSFLDADDFFETNMLRKAYDRAHTLETDITVFRSDQYYEKTGKFGTNSGTIRRDYLPKKEPFAGLDIKMDMFGAFISWAWDKLFRTEFVRENHLQFQEQYATNDMLFVFSALVKAERISTMNDVLVHYRKGESAVTAGRNKKHWRCFYDALSALQQQLKEWGLYDKLEQDFVNYSLRSTLWNLTSLKGQAYRSLYEQLKAGWLDDLGITGRDMDYFYNEDHYDQLVRLLAYDADQFLHSRFENASAASSLLAENSRMKRELVEIRESTTWKVGRLVLYLPIKVKQWIQGRRRQQKDR